MKRKAKNPIAKPNPQPATTFDAQPNSAAAESVPLDPNTSITVEQNDYIHGAEIEEESTKTKTNATQIAAAGTVSVGMDSGVDDDGFGESMAENGEGLMEGSESSAAAAAVVGAVVCPREYVSDANCHLLLEASQFGNNCNARVEVEVGGFDNASEIEGNGKVDDAAYDEEEPMEGVEEEPEEENIVENGEQGEAEQEEISEDDEDERIEDRLVGNDVVGHEEEEEVVEVEEEEGVEEEGEEEVEEEEEEEVEEEEEDDAEAEVEKEEDKKQQDTEGDEYMNNLLLEEENARESEIYIGRLHKEVVEEDLLAVFSKFGEIRGLKISRDPNTKKSKGFAFLRYASTVQAKNALSEAKDGIEVKGKHAKVSLSHGNDTLYMGNICKRWNKEQVLEKLKELGIENVKDIDLPLYHNDDGKNRGFAFIAFCKHSDAVAALLRLKKADAVFGSDRSAKVAFVQTPLDPTDEIMSQVKTVYVEALDDSWDEEKLKIVCRQYGDIEEVKFSKDLHNNHKRRNFGFLTFKTRENALACVQGLNKDQSGGIKVKANLARPHRKGGVQSQRAFGGFKVEKDNTVAVAPSNKDSQTILLSKKQRRKRKLAAMTRKETAAPEKTSQHGKNLIQTGRSTGKFRVHEESAVDVRSSQNSPAKVSSKKQKRKMKPSPIIREEPSTSKNKSSGKRKPAQTGRDTDGLVSKSIKRKRRDLSLKPLGPRKQSKAHFHERSPSKRSRGETLRKQDYSNMRQSSESNLPRSLNHRAHPPVYGRHYASVYDVPSTSYLGHPHSELSGSDRHSSDMAPHAGYVEPVAGNRSAPKTGYSIPSVGVRYPQAAYYDSYGKLVTASYDIGRTGQYEVVDRLQPTHGGSVHASAYASTQAYPGYTGTSSYVPTSYYYTGPSSSAYPPYQ